MANKKIAKRATSAILALCLVLSFGSAFALATQAADGFETTAPATMKQPVKNSDGYFLIAEISELRWFVNYVNTKVAGSKAILMADIDMNQEEWAPFTRTYTGIFDGNGYKIYNWKMTVTQNTKYIGFFGVTDHATVKNFTLEGELTITDGVTGTSARALSDVGSIVGYAKTGSTIENCVSRVNINVNTSAWVAYVGGIVGDVGGSSGSDATQVIGCTNYGNIQLGQADAECVGGIVGRNADNYPLLISNCANYGTISSTNTALTRGGIGGILGYVNNRTFQGLTHCYNGGSIEISNFQNFGAIAGRLNYNTAINNINCNYYLDGSAVRAQGRGLNASAAVVTAEDAVSPAMAWQLNNGDTSNRAWAMGTNGPVPTTSTTPAFQAVTLYLENSISINYYVKDTGRDLSLEVYDAAGALQATLSPVPGTGEFEGYWCFTYSDISAKKAGDTYLAVCKNNTDTAAVLYYSVAEYCDTVMNGEAYTDEFKTVCADLLNYAAAAQLYFQYKTDALVTSGRDTVIARYATQGAPTLDAVGRKENVEGATVSIYGATLALNDAVNLKFAFDIGDTDPSELAFSVTVDGITSYVDGATDPNGRLLLTVDWLTATQMRSAVKVQVVNTNDHTVGYSHIYTYSIDTYATNKKNDAALGNLMNLMIIYGDSTCQYFSK